MTPKSKGSYRLARCILFVLYIMQPIGSEIATNAKTTSGLSPGEITALRALCKINPNLSPLCSELNIAPPQECKPLPPLPTRGNLNNETLESLLASGVNDINAARLGSKTDKAIFILGNTGSGKTTATQIIAGNLARLHATRTKGGTLVIIDEDDRIGAPTTQSKTVIPIYVQHPQSGEAFWDNPGYDDNRGPIVDIAAMYFLKYAIDHTTSAKFLITVTHSSVRPGNDRNDFDLLATHTVRLFKNVRRLRDSIGLLVTKVGSFSHVSGERQSDDQIVEEITDFLTTYRLTKMEQLEAAVDPTEIEELQHKIDFVRGILGRAETNNKTRLFFLRSPEDCGSLDGMTVIQDTRRKITELYRNTLKYTSVTEDEFRVTLKAETVLQTRTEFVAVRSRNEFE